MFFSCCLALLLRNRFQFLQILFSFNLFDPFHQPTSVLVFIQLASLFFSAFCNSFHCCMHWSCPVHLNAFQIVEMANSFKSLVNIMISSKKPLLFFPLLCTFVCLTFKLLILLHSVYSAALNISTLVIWSSTKASYLVEYFCAASFFSCSGWPVIFCLYTRYSYFLRTHAFVGLRCIP